MFFDFLTRSKPFNVSSFLKTFKGHPAEFRKLDTDKLKCLLQHGFFEPKFPLELFVDYLIEIKWDFNEPMKGEYLALNSACAYSKNNIGIVKKMIQAGADVHAEDGHQRTALHEACLSDNLELVNHLLTLQVNVNALDHNYETPIFDAVKSGNLAVFNLLLENGAELKPSSENGATLLHLAVQHNSIDLLEKLLQLGFDIKVEDNFGRSVLDLARTAEMFKKLIEIGAPIIAYFKDSESCCEQALLYGDINLMKIFIENGAKPSSNNFNILFHINGEADFDHRDVADHQPTSLEMVEYLLTLKLDINLQHPETRMTPLMHICINGSLEQVILFLNHGADINLIDSEGRNALHYAARGGNHEIIHHLINICKFDPNCCTSNGQTPLHFSAANTTAIKVLIDSGADINAQDALQQTPLHVFVKNGDTEMVNLLLKFGARNDITNFNSKRPIDLCFNNFEMRKVFGKYSIYQYTALESLLLLFFY